MRFACLILICLMATGCSDFKSVENTPLSAGTSKTFPSDYDTVVTAARASIGEAGLTLTLEKSAGNGTLFMAQRPMTAASWGETVRVLVEPDASGATIVRVISAKTDALNVTAKDFTDDIFDGIREQLHESP